MLCPSRLFSISVAVLLLSVSFHVGLQAQGNGNAPAGAFPIPEEAKTYKQLITFVVELGTKEPEGRSEQELLAHRRKVARTVVAVTEQAMTLDLADEEAMECHYNQLLALGMLQAMDEPQAKEKFAQALAAARASSSPDIAAIGIKFMVESNFSNWQNLGTQEKTKMIDSVIDHVQNTKVGGEHLHLIMTVVGFLSEANEAQLAKHLLKEVSPMFLNSPDEQIQAVATKLEGISRRLDLLGKKIELSGTLMDGSQLDWSSYRGKVVLVDFWATWCGPCRTEVPNVLNMYRAYHEKGFEVLGVSLDAQLEQAETYIKQMEIPWFSLFSQDEGQRRWEHPMAVHYGVTGIPFAILVDREGKVISLEARGPELTKLLRRTLGEPLARAKTIEDILVQQVTNTEGSE